MKKILFIVCFCCATIYANDAIPIINTVFHGINTAVNLTRPTVIYQEPAVVQPIQSTVIVPNVPPVVYPNGYYEVYPTYYSYPRSYYYRGYYRPMPPPSPRYHHGGGHYRGHKR